MSHGTRHLPGPGMEPMSPVFASGCLTTGPPGKPQLLLLAIIIFYLHTGHKVMRQSALV